MDIFYYHDRLDLHPYLAAIQSKSNGLNPVFVGCQDWSDLGFDTHKLETDLCKNLLADFDFYYKHLSPNPDWYERICFKRWIYFYDYMANNDINEILVSDSDVLIFSSIDDLTSSLSKKNFEMLDIPYMNYIKSKNTLSDWINFFINFYKNNDLQSIAKVASKYAIDGQYVMSDMILMYEFSSSISNKVYRYTGGEQLADGIDPNLSNIGDKFKSFNGIRELKFDGKNIFCLSNSGEFLKFHTLHFQGTKKQLMVFFCNKDFLDLDFIYKNFSFDINKVDQRYLDYLSRCNISTVFKN